MAQPASQTYHVTFRCTSRLGQPVVLKMPAWTPGYYQLMAYAANVSNVQATDDHDKPLAWHKTGLNTWTIQPATASTLVFSYDVKATRNFVASPYLDRHKAYIVPAGLLMYVEGQLNHPVTVTLHPDPSWPDLVATGLDSIPGSKHTFISPDFDVLYDSPILMGELEQLPSFTLNGIPHYFVGYNMGTFDRERFMADLKKIVESSVAIIGDIPYQHYTFLAIGPGGGGIEHLNSTAVSFSGNGLSTRAGQLKMYNFLAHEYFHHYNVKRIRPIALGPFDYEHENRTNMLWVSEGLTVYYEYLILRRAGLISQEEVLNNWQKRINDFENKPGRLFQSATQASFDTWSDGPFGRQGDDAYKTISYYEKGPILGLLLDLAIRQATQNKHSLDDVMRTLYQDYYRQKNRGFTDEEFRAVCEKTAGQPLADVFAYAATLTPINYAKYLEYAGLHCTETSEPQKDAWLGFTIRNQQDSLLISSVEWNSPAWKTGLRTGDMLRTIDGTPVTQAAVQAIGRQRKAGDTIQVTVIREGKEIEKAITLEIKTLRVFTLAPTPAPTAQQATILASWLRGTR